MCDEHINKITIHFCPQFEVYRINVVAFYRNETHRATELRVTVSATWKIMSKCMPFRYKTIKFEVPR